jgi:hypothetical protein
MRPRANTRREGHGHGPTAGIPGLSGRDRRRARRSPRAGRPRWTAGGGRYLCSGAPPGPEARRHSGGRRRARYWAKAIARRRSDRARSSRADRRKGAECVERPERFRSRCHASSIAVNRQRSERLQPTAASRMAEAQSAIPWWAEPSSMFSLTVAPKDSAPWDPGKRHGFTTGELDDCVDERLWQRSSQRLRRDSG